MIMYHRGLILIPIILLILSIVPLPSNAAPLLHVFRQLAASEAGRIPNPNPFQMSPSPSPFSTIDLNSTAAAPASVHNNLGIPLADPPKKTTTEPMVTETCDKAPKQCHHKNLTACLGLQGSFLLVINDDDSSLKVNVTILPVNITYMEIDIPRHQAKKINISENVGGSSAIVLEAKNGGCIIHEGAHVPQNFYWQFPSYATYITPINGAYLLFVAAVIIGGTWTCCKLRKRKRHLDGVPYQELEMGQSGLVSSVNVETTGGWDEDWDDDWDEEKAVKSPGGNHVGSKTANGHTSKSFNSDGWGNDWDD